MVKLGALVVIVATSGMSHLFLAPSVCAVVALTVVETTEGVLGILGAWLIGIVMASFMRGR